MAPRKYRSKRKMGRKRKFAVKRRAYRSRTSKPTFIKRKGVLMRIYNSPITGNPTVLNTDGNGSIAIGNQVADTGATVQFGGGIRFQMQSALEYVDMTQFFDRYKITGVKLKFLYQHNNASNNNTGNNSVFPILNYSFDGDDDTIPSDYPTLAVKQYTKQTILNANFYKSVYIKPRITKEVYRTALTTGYTSERACWLDCANVNIAHFGLKLWIQNWNPGLTTINQLTIEPTYYFALKDTQ